MNECAGRRLAIHTPLYVYTPVWTYTPVNLTSVMQEVDVGVYWGLGLGALPLQNFSQKLLPIQNYYQAPFQWAYNVACSFPGL